MKAGTDDPSARFRSQLAASAPLLGTWVKTPSPIVCEVLARTPLDVLALDAEHAPFGRCELDACIAISLALGTPVLVRVPDRSPSAILNALDCGASGVLVPHVIDAQMAAQIVRSATYGANGRGYAGSTRAAGFGARSIGTQLEAAAAGTSVVLQIEDAEALPHIEAIGKVPGVAALFIGRVDLTVSLGKTRLDDPEVLRCVDDIVSKAAAVGVPVGMFVADHAEIPAWRRKGVNFFRLGSDHQFMQRGVQALVRDAAQ